MLISHRARPALAFVALLAAAFLLVGCGAAPATGWSSPVVVNQIVYFGSGTGKVYAVDGTTGSVAWEFPADQTSLGGVYTSPVVSDRKLYVGTSNAYAIAASGTTQFEDKPGFKKVYALNVDNKGAPLWAFALNDSIISTPAADTSTVYVGANDKKIYALDAATGQPKWNAPFETGGEIWADLTLADNMLYAASLDHKLYALDAATGTKKWDSDAGGMIVTKPAVVDGVVYFAGLSRVYALDAATGKPKWDKPFEASGWVWSNPTVVNGTVYFGTLDTGDVYALDAATGNPKWNAPFRAGGPVRSAIVIDNGIAYFGSDDFKVYALDAATGAVKWTFATNGRVVASPAVANGTVYVASYDRMFYALNGADGKAKWVLDTGSGKLVTPTPSAAQ